MESVREKAYKSSKYDNFNRKKAWMELPKYLLIHSKSKECVIIEMKYTSAASIENTDQTISPSKL